MRLASTARWLQRNDLGGDWSMPEARLDGPRYPLAGEPSSISYAGRMR